MWNMAAEGNFNINILTRKGTELTNARIDIGGGIFNGLKVVE